MSLDVTVRETAPCNAGSADLPAERETSDPDAGTLHSAMTDSDRRPFTSADWFAKFGAYFTPPALLTERRPALSTMRLYAQRGRYTDNPRGPARRFGLIWLAVAATPALVIARTWEWLMERPARFAVTVLTVKALSTLPPVAWTVGHLIKPGVDFTLWLFL